MESPWMTLSELAAYTKRGQRYLRGQIKRGALRAAVVGGRREVLSRREWADQWIEALAQPVDVSPRKGGR